MFKPNVINSAVCIGFIVLGAFLTFAYLKGLFLSDASNRSTQNTNQLMAVDRTSGNPSDITASQSGRLQMEELRYLIKVL